MLTTMAKDEEAAESRTAKLFISTHNRQSEECSHLIKTIVAGTCLKITTACYYRGWQSAVSIPIPF